MSGYRERLFKFVESQTAISVSERIAPAKGVRMAARLNCFPGCSRPRSSQHSCMRSLDEMLHCGDRRSLTTKQVRETEAEAVAFVVCQWVGLRTERIPGLHPSLARRRQSPPRELGSRSANRCRDPRGHCPRASRALAGQPHNEPTPAPFGFKPDVCAQSTNT